MRNRTNVYMSLKTPTPSQQAEQSANVYAKANIILQGGSVGAKTFSKTTLCCMLCWRRYIQQNDTVGCSVGAKTFSKTTLCCMFCWRQEIQQNDTLLDVLLAPNIQQNDTFVCSVGAKTFSKTTLLDVLFGAKNNQLNDTQ